MSLLFNFFCHSTFEQLSSLITWQVVELQRLAQYGQMIPLKGKSSWQRWC